MVRLDQGICMLNLTLRILYTLWETTGKTWTNIHPEYDTVVSFNYHIYPGLQNILVIAYRIVGNTRWLRHAATSSEGWRVNAFHNHM